MNVYYMPPLCQAPDTKGKAMNKADTATALVEVRASGGSKTDNPRDRNQVGCVLFNTHHMPTKYKVDSGGGRKRNEKVLEGR